MAPLNIAIVGAGIGGLAAAAGLARQGHQVTVFERSKTRGGVGFAFRIGPHADRCLADLGIDAVAGGGLVSAGTLIMDREGRLLGQAEKSAQVQSQGPRSVFAYRPQLLDQLWEVAEKAGAVIEEDVKVLSVDAAASTLSLEGGRIVHADLIIGADGVHSTVRSAVLDTQHHYPIATTGRNAFRFMLPMKSLINDPLTRDLYSGPPRNFAWIDGPTSFISYPVDFGRHVNVVCAHPQELSDSEAGHASASTAIDYSQPVSLATALSIYTSFPAPARRHLELADAAATALHAWKLRDMPPAPRWSLHHTLLLGDAVHAVLPFGFNGAAMAIEDAAVLYTLLPAGTGVERLRERLGVWEEMRRPRVDRVREYSRTEAHTPRGVEEYLAFLAPYDAVGDAKVRLEGLEEGNVRASTYAEGSMEK